jgi:outer membrane protein TolC
MLLTYVQALDLASTRATAVVEGTWDVASAEGALLAARAPFEPTFGLEGSTFSLTQEGEFQANNFLSDTRGWGTDVSLSQALATGTSFSLSGSADYTRARYRFPDLSERDFEGDPAWSTRLALSASQALLQGHRLAYNLQGVHAATATRDAARAELTAARGQARVDAATAYWNLHYQRRLVEIARQTEKVSRAQAEVAVALVAAGKLAPVEKARFDAAVASAIRARMAAEQAAAGATDTLLVLVGEATGGTLDLADHPLPPVDVAFDEAAVIERVRAGNPTLSALRVAADSARDAERTARHALLPELALSGSAALRGYEEDLSGSLVEAGSGELPELSAALTLSMPLLNRSDRGALASRTAEAGKAQATLRATEEGLVQSARAQVRALRDAAKNLELARQGERLAEQTLSAEEAKLGEGRALQRDVIQAVRDLDQARADSEKALLDWLVAVVTLQGLEGAL